MDASQVFHLLLALLVLLAATRFGGRLAEQAKLPPVIGEIAAGLVLGPSVIGALAPELHADVFPDSGPVADSLDAFYELGLLLLMFAAGLGLRALPTGREARTVAVITVAATLIPLAAGVGAGVVIDLEQLEGTAGNETALVIVFAAALAVTSIPVISRIMLDLGLLGTRFSRLVLGSAVAEDVLLYGLLAVAVGLTQQAAAAGFGLPAELGIDSASLVGALYYAALTPLVLLLPLVAVRRARQIPQFTWTLDRLGNEAPHQLLFLLLMATVCAGMGVIPIFGALVAGLIVNQLHDATAKESSVGRFSLAFFIPLYFGLVGLRVDLQEDADLVLLVTFISVACLIKAGAVYLGARVAGEGPQSARALSVALNARGGPGIVLASVALAAGIISEEFFVTLVTSALAGWWLRRLVADRGAGSLSSR